MNGLVKSGVKFLYETFLASFVRRCVKLLSIAAKNHSPRNGK